MRGDVAPVKPPVDDGGGDANGHAGEGHCLAPGSLDGLLGRGHHLGGHWGDRSRSEGCEGQREEEWGRRAGLRLWTGPWEPTHPGVQGPWLASPNPGPHSLQPNSSLRSGQSLSSSQWKLAGMHVFVETQRNCVGPHTSSGRLAARGQSQAVWAACTALRKDHPFPHLHPTVNPAYVPLVFPGSLSLLTRMTHSCPDETHTLLPQHCQLSPAGHQMAHHITLSPPLAAPAFPKTETQLAHYSHSVPSTLSRPQKHKTSVKGTGKVTGIPRRQVMPVRGSLPGRPCKGPATAQTSLLCTPLTVPGGPPGLRPPPGDWSEAWGWPGTRAGPQLGISRRQ